MAEKEANTKLGIFFQGAISGYSLQVLAFRRRRGCGLSAAIPGAETSTGRLTKGKT
jgi:hypothetical protein